MDQEERLERRRKANGNKQKELKKMEEELEAVRTLSYFAVLALTAVLLLLTASSASPASPLPLSQFWLPCLSLVLVWAVVVVADAESLSNLGV